MSGSNRDRADRVGTKKIAWREGPAPAGLRQADPLLASPNLYVQPRSRKNKNRIGIGIPKSHSKTYPVAPICSNRSLSLMPSSPFSLSYYFVTTTAAECVGK